MPYSHPHPPACLHASMKKKPQANNEGDGVRVPLKRSGKERFRGAFRGHYSKIYLQVELRRIHLHNPLATHSLITKEALTPTWVNRVPYQPPRRVKWNGSLHNQTSELAGYD